MDEHGPNAESSQIESAFRKLLDSHGYGFQYAVMRKVHELSKVTPGLLFEVAEFPVTADHPTRIDFVLRRSNRPLYFVFECKRANPALKDWCFCRAPYVRRNRDYERLYVETALRKRRWNPPMPRFDVRGMSLGDVGDAYHIGFEVKGAARGDESGRGRGAIDEAVAQVFRGVYGLIGAFAELADDESMEPQRQIVFPVIVTTARLWTSDVALDQSDLQTGNVSPGSLGLSQTKWVFLQCPVASELRGPGMQLSSGAKSLSDALDLRHTRTVTIVNSEGLEAFLTTFRGADAHLQDIDTFSMLE